MANYYFLATLLPELKLHEPPEIDYYEFLELLETNLSSSDLAKTVVIHRYYDILNIRAYWKGEPLDPFGFLAVNELEEALVARTQLPSYVFDYMDTYETTELRIEHFPQLIKTFFREEAHQATSFNRFFLTLEREIRLVLLAFRAKKLGKDLLKELQYEDPEDPMVAQILAQKDAPIYEPPEKYEDLKSIFETHYQDPLAIHRALIEYRFKKIEEFLGIRDFFSINRILGYMVKLILVEKWQKLDQAEGKKIVDTILKDAK